MAKRPHSTLPLSGYERFGLATSIIGLVADVLALGAFGISLSQLREPRELAPFWFALLSLVPLAYFWAFLAWLTSRKYGKPILATVFTGLCISPIYFVWGAIPVGQWLESLLSRTQQGPDNASQGIVLGILCALVAMFATGMMIYLGLDLWRNLARTGRAAGQPGQ